MWLFVNSVNKMLTLVSPYGAIEFATDDTKPFPASMLNYLWTLLNDLRISEALNNKSVNQKSKI